MTDRIAIDWTACRARGTCSELLPERIRLDEWGYPLIDPAPVTGDLRTFARMAVDSCPTRALRLQPISPKEPLPRTQPSHSRTGQPQY